MAITFDSIGNGDLAAKFRNALGVIGRNIVDPNMELDAAREITVGIKFKPNESGAIEVTYGIKTKLAGPAKAKTTFLIGQDARTGRIEMTEHRNGRPQVAAYEVIPAAQEVTEPERVGAEAGFDPETGEIYETGKPIDLRKQRA